MSGVDMTLAGADLVARFTGALWWPAERLLCVSDLHLGRSERLARRGGTLLPPYESRETLARLADEIARSTRRRSFASATASTISTARPRSSRRRATR
jgi:uncharacterized protein